MEERVFTPDMDTAVISQIDDRLDLIEKKHRVVHLLAIESGSRAWGFPSPDSDYDCRFIYQRTLNDSVTLFPKRDVIETPITPIFDVSGWDLSKALLLALKGNAVVAEWLSSPIIYRSDTAFRSEMLELLNKILDRQSVMRHYLHLGRAQLNKNKDELALPVKKMFYIIRPLIALRWMLEHPSKSVAPMHLPTLLENISLNEEIRSAIIEAIEQKRQLNEKTIGDQSKILLAFIKNEHARLMAEIAPSQKNSDENKQATDNFYRRWIIEA